MMGRLVSLRRRSRMGLGSGDSHPSFNFYVQYYVEATSGNMSPYPWKTAYKLIRESLQGYYLEDPRTFVVWPSLLNFLGPPCGVEPARLCFTSYNGLLLLGLLSKYYVQHWTGITSTRDDTPLFRLSTFAIRGELALPGLP